MPGRGLRKHGREAAAANTLTEAFRGLDAGVTRSMALGALKRARPYMGIPPRIVALMDTLFKYSRDADWRGGRIPTVWPSNEALARELEVSVRQVQNLLRQAEALGLLSFRDSPNGKRGGCRNAQGDIIWAYGIILAPMGTRYQEFSDHAHIGAEEDGHLKRLKRRLEAVRRKLRMLTQAAMDNGFGEREAWSAMDVVLMATNQMRNNRDIALYTACVQQQEACASALEATLNDGFAALDRSREGPETSCWHEPDFTHSTTTNQLHTAKAVTCRGLAVRRSGAEDVAQPIATVEEEMAAHGVGLGFISELAYELHPTLRLSDEDCSWGEVVSVAERLSHQAGISGHAFHEAVRVMGQRGAAASVIVTLQKYRRGDVHRPGAYLRGMSRKATSGTLKLGPTLHGLRDANRSQAMKCLADTGTIPIGAMLPGLLRKAKQG
ncbi:replication protein C [Sphingomonas solaris]|uniref:Replication protein C n=2 Tax=Alterirhizorhabdus solaris TaxID=2529389 RepID=A0A558RC80_9SPHN|nr:replication protein C [Sphingomonas solaris]